MNKHIKRILEMIQKEQQDKNEWIELEFEIVDDENKDEKPVIKTGRIRMDKFKKHLILNK